MCLTPITLKKEYRSQKDSSKKDGSGLAHTVPCGKCIKCLQKRQNQWSFRLYEEMKISESAFFVTLTYEETPLSFNGNPTLDKTDFQKFMKRLRKRASYKTKNKLKYYACGEYGTRTQRPHYHCILYNYPAESLVDIQKSWQHGHIRVDPCNIATIRYVCKYVMKGSFEPQDELDDREPEFSLMSKKMGLGYLTPQMYNYHKNNLIPVITQKGGHLLGLPRYFKEKIFSKKERQIMAEESRKIAELKVNELFYDAHHQLIWKKDQIRKEAKKQSLERQKL